VLLLLLTESCLLDVNAQAQPRYPVKLFSVPHE
jgi:hypothetical protein